MYFVYILRSRRNNKSYTGMTSKIVSARLEEHNIGSNTWTKQNSPFDLIYYESYYCKKDALHRENFLKSGIGRKLLKLIIKYY